MSGTVAQPRVLRGFVSIDEGQVHYRCAGPMPRTGDRPMLLIHASPGSSRMLEPLILALAAASPGRTVIALDTLGNGDSVAPSVAKPDLAYFASAHCRALDALGIGECDLYGAHTGAGIAAEMAIMRPALVHRLVLDGMSVYKPAQRDEFLARYAPGIAPDLHGGHLNWVWHFVRDTYLFWPWFKNDRAHVRQVGLPSADTLHVKVLEVLKGLTTYHLSYQASIGYDKAGRLPLVKTPTLVVCARDDMLYEYFERIAAMVPGAERCEVAGLRSAEAAMETAHVLLKFFEHPATATQGETT